VQKSDSGENVDRIRDEKRFLEKGRQIMIFIPSAQTEWSSPTA
jgi:hypothetical protein